MVKASGYIYPVAEMKDLGIDPLTDCTLTTVNDIPSEMTAVLNGQQDACFVFQGARYVFSSKFTDYDLYKDLKVLYLTDGDISRTMRSQYSRLWTTISRHRSKMYS